MYIFIKRRCTSCEKNYHLSVLDIEKIIEKSRVENVFLTHISARYDRSIEKEAIDTLSSKCMVRIAHDLEEYSL